MPDVGTAVGTVAAPIVGKVLGGGGTSTSSSSQQTVADPRATFKPVTVTTGAGTAKITGGDKGVTGTFELDPRLAGLRDLGLAQAPGLFNQYLSSVQGYQPRTLGLSWDPTEATNSYFQSKMNALTPQFEQQRQKLSNQLFGSGRMGLSLAGSSVGAGEGTGMVNPDAFGLSLAENRATSEAWDAARSQGLAELANQLTFLGRQDTSQLGLSDLYASGAQNMLGLGTFMNELERQRILDAMNIESQRSSTYGSGATTTNSTPVESFQSKLAGNIGGAVGDWVGNNAGSWFGGGSSGPSSSALNSTLGDFGSGFNLGNSGFTFN